MTDKSPMSIFRVISLLQDRADRDECDGECDQVPPYEPCESCGAARALNEASEILRGAL